MKGNFKYINKDPGIMSGQLCMKNTRFPIDMLLIILAENGIDQFLKDYDYYTKEQVLGAVNEIAKNVDELFE